MHSFLVAVKLLFGEHQVRIFKEEVEKATRQLRTEEWSDIDRALSRPPRAVIEDFTAFPLKPGLKDVLTKTIADLDDELQKQKAAIWQDLVGNPVLNASTSILTIHDQACARIEVPFQAYRDALRRIIALFDATNNALLDLNLEHEKQGDIGAARVFLDFYNSCHTF